MNRLCLGEDDTDRGFAILLRRERLLALLALPGHVVLWASPGSGKSTLLRHFAESAESAGRRVLLIDGSDPAAVGAALAADDADEVLIDNADALAASVRDRVGRMLEDDDDVTRLVVAGRRDPFPVSPARWLATRELRTADLAFTESEVAELLRRRGLDLAARTIGTLTTHTDGWAAGLALACHVLSASDDADVAAASFTGAHVAIGDYLMDAVLGSLSESDRSVLVTAAVDRSVSSDLAVAVTGRDDAAEVLDALARRNLLVERAADGRYVYHPVLYAYLTAEARRSAPGAQRDAHRRAAAYLIETDGSAALAHSVAAGDDAGIDTSLRRWGIELVVRGDPTLLSVLGEVESDAAVLLRRMLQAPYFEGTTSPGLRPWDAASAVVVRALRAFDPEPRSAAATVLGAPGERDPEQPGRAATLFARFVVAGRRPVDGSGAEAADAVRELHRVADAAAELDHEWLRVAALESALTAAHGTPHWTAAKEVLSGDAGDAMPSHVLATGVGARLMLLQAGLAYLRCEPLPERLMRVLLSADFARSHPLAAQRARALEAFATIGCRPAREAVDRLDRLMVRAPIHDPQFLSFLLVPWLSAATHHGNRPMLENIAGCAQRAFGADSVEAVLATFVLRPERVTEVELRSVLDRGRSWDPLAAAHGWARLAVHAAAHGATAKATQDLTEAVMAAHRRDAARVFALFGGDALTLLREHADRLGPWSGAAAGLVVQASDAVGASGAETSVSLTPREQALLDELPVHQTVADIAHRQQLSPNTIKSQLKSVYRKLGVDNRADAIDAGRRAGLLDGVASTPHTPAE